ncbi:MAG TPA: NADH-quinone oxidoreductase subunit M, partial [Actinotalea sp.]|nr:NADH-quinone oxidoreductase subunit M [Actinotalea sp.]
GLSALSLPGLSTFVSEFLVLVGTFGASRPAAVVAALGAVLAALYVLLTYQRAFTGPVKAGLEHVPDLTLRERWVVGPLIAVMIVLGFVPSPALDLVREPASVTLEQVGVDDVSPTITATDGSEQ